MGLMDHYFNLSCAAWINGVERRERPHE